MVGRDTCFVSAAAVDQPPLCLLPCTSAAAWITDSAVVSFLSPSVLAVWRARSSTARVLPALDTYFIPAAAVTWPPFLFAVAFALEALLFD